jgi:hypothetical protein
MDDDNPVTTSYQPVHLGERVNLPLLSHSGLSEQKYLVLPAEYFDVEQHVLLDGSVLIPMKNDYDQENN